jgi:hypothetical protein
MESAGKTRGGLAMGKQIITPEILALKAEREAFEARTKPEPLPPLVKAFWEHVQRNPPAWRYQESEGERAERQALENLGLGSVEPRPIRGAA